MKKSPAKTFDAKRYGEVSISRLLWRNSSDQTPRNGGFASSLLAILMLYTSANASSAGQSLADMSLEQLMNETVTSVSKKEQKLGEAPAAISVLSNEDLRRSGATSIAEALRMVPGMNVGAVNSSQWAISARGFNGVYANKLLVMVDGRAVYTPLFAGVYWDLQQTMLEDVDRLEVIRGPGATVWGANAVNGVINVVTLSAKDTQGGVIYGGGGDVHRALGGGRYGGKISDDTFYRVFGSYQMSDDYTLSNGQSADDSWQGWHGGFRLDHYIETDTRLTWQSDVTVSDLDDHVSDAYNVNTLGRWTRDLSDRSSIEAQAYYDRTYRNEAMRARSTADTIDLTMQHTFGLSERNDLMWGVGYRFIGNKIEQTSPLAALRNGDFDLHLFSAFLQDDFKVVPDKFTITLGTKVEHNDFTGFEVQPSLRAVFKPTEHQTIWTAVSRAVRTPSEIEGSDVGAITVGAPFEPFGPGNGFYTPTLVGNADPDAEVLWAYELGYRLHPGSFFNVEINAFYNDYSDIITYGVFGQFIPGAPGTAELPLFNYQSGETYGGEVSTTVDATDAWRLTASYSLLLANINGPVVSDPESAERSAPRHQVALRSAYDFTKHSSLDVQCRYVDNIRAVSAYITADIRVSYRPTERLEISIVGQNLLDNRHPEHGTELLSVTAEVPRGIYGKVTLRF